MTKELMKKIINLNIPHLPSFESYFVAENKTFFKKIQKYDNMNVIPRTIILSEKNINSLKNNKNKLVLKPSKSFGGKDIIFGEDVDYHTWKIKLEQIMMRNENKKYIFQEKCFLKKQDNKYFDIAVYVVENKVKGIISRSSKNKIVNVGKDGFLKPVVLDF